MSSAEARELKAQRQAFAALIRVERLRREWTQDDLARRAGLSTPTVRKVENAEEVRERTWIALERAIGWTGEGANASTSSEPDAEIDALERMVAVATDAVEAAFKTRQQALDMLNDARARKARTLKTGAAHD